LVPVVIARSAVLGFLIAASVPRAQNANYDESRVGDVALPQLASTTPAQWRSSRRPEILRLFAEHEYGRTPDNLGRPRFRVDATKVDALNGLATRRLVHVDLPDHPRWRGMEVLLYVPNGRALPVPCFVGLSFGGNHAVTTEPDVPLSTRWMDDLGDRHVVGFRATERCRGTESRRWPLARILARGYAVATAYYGDLEPDHADGWRDGLRGAVSPEGADTVWSDSDWGAIGAWAQGLRLIVDYLETDEAIDGERIAGIGHSRLGKTTLWAGAQDERFGIVIANNAGEGGAALMRRDFGETTALMTRAFPHWFAKRYATYADRPAACPVDQHMLLALIAPRLAYVASASEDLWADPMGEFLAAKHASAAWSLFDFAGVVAASQPAVNTPVGDHVGYHLRAGKHDLTEYDWQRFLDFADRHWRR
jgi:hypothetical protein